MKPWAVTEAICYILWLTIIIFSIYTNIKLCMKGRIETEMYIQKRSVSSFYLLNFSFTATILSILCTSYAFLHLSNTIIALTMSFAIALTYLLYFCLIIKSWMIYFKFKWTYYTMEMDWQYIINPNAVSNKIQQNWYIRNNNKYGNLFYNYKLFGFLCFTGYVMVAIPSTLWVLSNYEIIHLIVNLFSILFSVTPLSIFYCYIVIKTPNINDTYDIHSESKMHAKLCLLIAVVLLIINICFIIFEDLKVIFLGSFVMGLILFAMSYVSTVILPKNHDQNKKNNLIRLKLIAPPQSNSITSTYTTTKSTCKSDIQLDQILINERALNLFMFHLSKEYSMELLLSYIEFTQFQQSLRPYINNDAMAKLEEIKLLDFSENVPISEIVEKKTPEFEMSEIDNAKIKAHELYNKYIKVGCPFEVNISALDRNELNSVLRDLEVLMSCNIKFIDLFLLFENTKKQMKLLQKFSLQRFKSSNDFASVVVFINN